MIYYFLICAQPIQFFRSYGTIENRVISKIYIEYVQVQIGHDESDYFMCKVGVRQFLFSIYINDLEDYL